VLIPADCLQGKLWKIRARCEADTRGRFTRRFPGLSRFWIFSFCQIDECRQIVLLLRNRETGIALGGGAPDGRFWNRPGSLGARRRLRERKMAAEHASNNTQTERRAINALPKQHAEPPTGVVGW